MDRVKTEGLTKIFGDIIAVNKIDLAVPEGSVFGLLGPNGAGKSTTVRLLCTLLRPTEGTAIVSGHDIRDEPLAVRQTTGLLPEEGSHTLYPRMSAYRNLEYFAKLYGIPDKDIPGRIEELLRFMGLWERRDDPAGELSTGNRQRLALCRAILHSPTVALLDEPTASLDPIAAKRVRELILSLAREYGITFFINSHNLAEVQRICDRVAIIDHGKILLAGETEEIRSQLGTGRVFRVRVVGDPSAALSVAESAEFVEEARLDDNTLVVKVRDPEANNSRLMMMLIERGVRILEFAQEEMSLEDVYLAVVDGGED